MSNSIRSQLIAAGLVKPDIIARPMSAAVQRAVAVQRQRDFSTRADKAMAILRAAMRRGF